MKEGVITVMKVDSNGKPKPTFADKARDSRKKHFNPPMRRIFGVSNHGIIRQSKSFALCAKYVIAAAKIDSPQTPESEKSGAQRAWDKELFSIASRDEQLAVMAAIEGLKSKFGNTWHETVLEFEQAASKTEFGDKLMGAPSKPKRLAKEVFGLIKAKAALPGINGLTGYALEAEVNSLFSRQSPLVQELIAEDLKHITPKA